MLAAPALSAHELLRGLIGRSIPTVTGRPNTVLEVGDVDVIVATRRSPQGTPVPIGWVQDALDRLIADGDVELSVESLGHRSAFVGAVLLTLPGTVATATAIGQRPDFKGVRLSADDGLLDVNRRHSAVVSATSLDGAASRCDSVVFAVESATSSETGSDFSPSLMLETALQLRVESLTFDMDVSGRLRDLGGHRIWLGSLLFARGLVERLRFHGSPSRDSQHRV